MADGLSIASGIAGLISLGLQTANALVQFYTSYKDRNANISRTTGRLESLATTFRTLDTNIQRRKFRQDEKSLIEQIECSVRHCEEALAELQDECKKLKETSSGSIKSIAKVAGRRVAYPFRESTLKKLDENVGELRDGLSLAVNVLQLQDHQTTQDDIAEVRSVIELMRATQISSSMRDWLRAPDVTVNYYAAYAKRHLGTGSWLVRGPVFRTWLSQENSFLWLNGFAGCGKSVLCSTAIQHAFRQSAEKVGIAFFYFTFDDESKQDESALLRALLSQLTGQLPDGDAILTRLRDEYKSGPPSAVVLIERLRFVIQKFLHVYILIDALDESPRGGRRDAVLHSLRTIQEWTWPGMHLLVTSRDVLDIRESLYATSDQEVVMKRTEIDQDIANFITVKLDTDLKLRRKWLGEHSRIQKALAERAQGVFRWVECQLEDLKRCPGSQYHLDRCLQSLPRSLDETYERMLCNIDEDLVEEARRMLILLCFASRPLTVAELLHAMAVDLNEPAHLDKRRVLTGEDDLRNICPGLIDFGVEQRDLNEYSDFDEDRASKDSDPDDSHPDESDFKDSDSTDNDSELSVTMSRTKTVRIAHFSVQEYLESDRIRQQKAASFALSSTSAHVEIAKICCAYLLEPELSNGRLSRAKLRKFPLAHFAALFWRYHYGKAVDTTSQLRELIMTIFTQPRTSFCTWIALHDHVDAPERRYVSFQRNSRRPVYYASGLGLDWVLDELLRAGTKNKYEVRNLVNARGGKYGAALQVASDQGHEKIVQILLEAGAEVNASGSGYPTPLAMAADRGHEKIVQILLEAGAEINALGNGYGTLLAMAADGGHEKIVQVLLEAGAEINALGNGYGTPLAMAAVRGHEKIVQVLLEAGAEINALGNGYGTLLAMAADRGYEKTVQILLEAGAEINASGSAYRTPLAMAVVGGHEKIVQILLEAGAEINASGSGYGTLLAMAADGGHEKILQILLEAGAKLEQS